MVLVEYVDTSARPMKANLRDMIFLCHEGNLKEAMQTCAASALPAMSSRLIAQRHEVT
jgi:hypothetical protein